MAGVQGSGSATKNAGLVLIGLLCLMICAGTAESATYTVGDSAGWNFNMASWTNGKRFRTGDVLVFKYDPTAHNVVAVNSAGYNGCTTPRGSRVFKSGNDRITLAKGTNYFMCSFTGHCQAGMKVAVTAA